MSEQSYPTGAIEIASGVYAFIQAGGATDAGFIAGDDGVVVVDTLMTATLARALMAEVRAVTSAPLLHIVNTHWHGDHVFGNAVLPTAPIIAHDTCREDLLAEWDGHRAFLRDLYPAAWPEISELPATPPNVTFDSRLTIHLADRVAHLRHFGRAHTRGDIVVHMPDDGVVFAGDLAFHDYIPNARDGFPRDWINAARELERLDCDVVVPGHGPLGTTGDVARMRECLELIVGQIEASFERGMSADEARASLQLGAFASWGRQEDRLPTLVARTYRDLRGEFSDVGH